MICFAVLVFDWWPVLQFLSLVMLVYNPVWGASHLFSCDIVDFSEKNFD